MVEAFQEETGIPTAFQRMSSGESLVRLQAGAAAPEFDVWWGGPADGQIAAAEGLVEPYVSPNAAAIAEGQKAEDGTWTGVYVGALGFCSNTELLDELGVEAPDSWEDLLDPRLDDNVQVAHPASSGTAYTTFYTQVARFGGDEEAALDYMRQLHDNILYYTKSGAAPGRNAGSGEVAVAIIFSHDCIDNIEQGMTDLVVVVPREGTGYEIAGQSLVANAPHPNNAKTWIDWALTGPAQEIGRRRTARLPAATNPDAAVSDQAVNISELKLVDYDFDAAGEARSRLTEQFENEIATAPAE